MIRIYSCVLVFVSLLFSSCEKVMDKTNLANITSDKVLNDINLARANLNRIYVIANPTWQWGQGGNSDEAAFGSSGMMYGRLLDFSQTQYASFYTQIREINVFLDGLKAGSLPKADTDPMRGQALFFRAHLYWQLVTTYGGVPLVLSDQQLSSEYNLPRNSTTETVAQIIKDLDEAATLLPNNYTGEDFGRVYKGLAMAYKGRILLHYASEQFDPNQSRNRWQAAYDALVAAKTSLDGIGKGLHANFEQLFFDDNSTNREIIWVRLFNSDVSHLRDAQVRPCVISGVCGGRTDNPTRELVDAFPMLDGKKINTSTNYAYDPAVFWRDRDPRLAATVAWNGANYPIRDVSPFKTSPLHWTFQDHIGTPDANITVSGMHCRKAVRTDYDIAQARVSTVPWIEMRYAEVLLNLAEAANEVGRGSEALSLLFAIRQRAGIDNKDGRYGLDAGIESNKSAMRETVLNERMIELAFENKRVVDFRRRRLYARINGKERTGFFITRTAAFNNLVTTNNEILADRMELERRAQDGRINLNDPVQYSTYFKVDPISVEEGAGRPGQAGVKINYQDKYYFFDIPQTVMARNPKLKQTNGWPGGSFDPLQ